MAGRPHVAIGILCGPTGGPATYGRLLVEALLQRDDVALSVLTDRPDAFDAAARPVHVPFRGGVDRLRWTHLAIPAALSRLDCDLYHDTKNALPVRLPVPAVVTVHDLAYYRCPETFPPLSRVFLRRSTAAAVRRARRIVVPSAATAADVAAVFSVGAEKVRVVHHGIAPATPIDARAVEQLRQRYDLTGPWILHVGTVQARKNVHLLVRAVRQLRAEGFPHRLLVVGRKGWLAAEAMREVERDDTARWLGAVPGGELRAFYALADVFAAPSGYEGFGFTVADALAAGVPTVISGLSSLPELCGDAAEQVETLSVDGVAAALRRVVGDPARAAALRRAGPARAAEFAWSRSAEGHAAVYGEAVAAAPSRRPPTTR